MVAFGSGLCSRSLPVRCGHLSWWQSELGFRRAVTRNERERESGRDCQHFFFSFPLLRIGEHRNHNQEGELPPPPPLCNKLSQVTRGNARNLDNGGRKFPWNEGPCDNDA